MADEVVLNTPPLPPDTGADKLPEAKITSEGDTTRITVDTTQEPKKPAAKTDRPAWLPEEFETPEQFAEAYKKSKDQPKTEEKKTEPLSKERVDKAVQDAGLDMLKLNEEFSKDGKLSDESIAKLEKAGIGKDVLNDYIEGQRAQATLITQRINESVGGEEHLKATLEWAAQKLSAPEIEAANRVLASGDEAQMKLVLTGLNQRRLAEVGIEPNLVSGKAGAQRGEAKGYASTAEWIADINSPKYRSDPAKR